jgi:photosystem II stability/assembly factor-like uncharacterized protein
MKTLRFLLFLLFVTAIQFYTETLFAQQQDTTKEKPTQYRRGIELQEGYQSYEEKYSGKNLNEEKRRLFPLQSTGVWTELNPKVPRVDYLGIHFVNSDTGWAVGDLGSVIKTTDGGQSWSVSETNTTTPILKARSFNEQLVISSGFDGMILRSIDGGETFTQVTSGVTGDLWGLQMLNDTLGWACGTANSLVKTTDAGITWQTVTVPGYTADYWWIDFLTESYGFIAANGKVLRTIDGGQNWEIIQAGDNQALFCVDVIDSLHIAAAGYGGTSYRGKNIYSSDGGYTWINGGPTTFDPINCIKYINPDTGYIVMSEVSTRKTTDRGQSWTIIGQVNDNMTDNYELQFTAQNTIGYSVGNSLKLNKAEGNLDIWNRLIINDNFSDVFFVSEQKGFAISWSGISSPSGLYKATDGGINWERVSGAPDGTELLFLDSLTGFIGSNQIYKTTDGGVTWYVPNGGQGGAGKIFFINQEIGWAVRSNVIYKTTDMGENWFEQSNSGWSFTSIYFVDSLYGWASQIGGRPFKTTDGGLNWIEQTNLNIWESDDIYFIDSLNAWIISGNELYYTNNSGSNWTLDPQIYTYSWHFEAISDSHYIITGGNIYESVDAGQVWQNITSQTGSGFTSLHAPRNYLAYGVGTLGYIVSYLDTSIVPVELVNFSAEYSNNKINLYWMTATEANNYGFEILKSTDSDNWTKIGFVFGYGTTTERSDYSFTDDKVFGSKIYYKLKQIDYDGRFTYSKTIIVSVENLPLFFNLSQNFPNPFNNSTVIRYQIPKNEFITLKIFDVLGNEVKTLTEGNKVAGYYSVTFSADFLSSGIYFYKLTSGEYSSTKKLILLK